MLSSSNGQAQAAGDCLYYEGQTFTETDTFTWTPPPAQISLPLYGSSSEVWWQGTLTGTAALSIPSAYNQPQVSLDIRAVQSTHPSDSYYVTASAPASAKMTPTGTITIAAINGGAFTPDAHTGSPPLDPSPVVSARVGVNPSATGMLVFYLKYTYTRQ